MPSMAPAADRTVGPGCTYATIAAAVAAASPGDRLRLAGNVTFAEHVTVSKNLTVEGGYNCCTQRLQRADDPRRQRPVGLSWISPRVRWH